MIIKCGICSKEISVDSELVEGQHIRCPYCGEKSEYHRPSRVKISDATTKPAKRRLTANSKKKTEEDHVPFTQKSIVSSGQKEESLVEKKAHVGLIRPKSAKNADEKKITLTQNQKKISWTVLMSKEHPIYYSVAIAVAGLAVIGVLMINHSQKTDELKLMEAARESELRLKERDAQLRIEQEERQKKRDEERRLEQERIRSEREAKELSRRKEQALKEEARAKERIEAAQAKERARKVDELARQIVNAPLDYWRNCPRSERPQGIQTPKEYVCIVPKDKDAFDCMVITASPDKELEVKIYDGEGNLSPIKTDEFNDRISTGAYLISTGDKSWICGVDKDTEGMKVVSRSTSLNPAQRELGVMYDFICSRSSHPQDIAYNIYFEDKKGRRQYVCRVGFGSHVSADEVKPRIREMLQDVAEAKRGNRQEKKPKFKRTVVFGAVPNIRRPIQGPIVIPYSMPMFQGYGVDESGGYYVRNEGRHHQRPLSSAGGHRSRHGHHAHYNYVQWSRKSSNSSGAREQEYLNLRAVAEKEDEEEALWRSRQEAELNAKYKISECDVENVLFSGTLYFLPAK